MRSGERSGRKAAGVNDAAQGNFGSPLLVNRDPDEKRQTRGRESLPVGRPDFKPGRGRRRSSVGSTPTLFRHPFMRCVVRFVLCATFLAASATHAVAQTTPMRVVVPYPPGGGTDILGRAMAQKMG